MLSASGRRSFGVGRRHGGGQQADGWQEPDHSGISTKAILSLSSATISRRLEKITHPKRMSKTADGIVGLSGRRCAWWRSWTDPEDAAYNAGDRVRIRDAWSAVGYGDCILYGAPPVTLP